MHIISLILQTDGCLIYGYIQEFRKNSRYIQEYLKKINKKESVHHRLRGGSPRNSANLRFSFYFFKFVPQVLLHNIPKNYGSGVP